MDERNDRYELRRVPQPPRGVDGATLLSLADDEFGSNGADLTESLRIADRLFRDDDFAAATAALPTLITHARGALTESTEDQRQRAWAPLAKAYLLAATFLTQLRKDDLAYHTLGLALEAGANAQDNALVGLAVGGETWLLIRLGRLDDAIRVALAAAERLEPSFGHSDRRHISSWGWLNLGVAAAAARNSQQDVMEDSWLPVPLPGRILATDSPRALSQRSARNIPADTCTAPRTANAATASGHVIGRCHRPADRQEKRAAATCSQAGRGSSMQDPDTQSTTDDRSRGVSSAWYRRVAGFAGHREPRNPWTAAVTMLGKDRRFGYSAPSSSQSISVGTVTAGERNDAAVTP